MDPSGTGAGREARRLAPGDALAAVGLAATLLAVYLWASFSLSSGVDVRRYSSGIYDMDAARVVSDLTTPRPGLRTSVHPLQKLLVAPLGEAFDALLFDGRDRLAAARVLIALAAAAQALAAGALAWQLTAGARMAALAAVLLCGASFSSLLAASVPESAVFASLPGLLPLLLLGARRGRPLGWGESGVWALLAVPAVGMTLTQIVPWAIALAVRLGTVAVGGGGRRRRGGRLAAVLGLGLLLVAAAAVLQSRVYPGTDAFRHANPVAGERAYLRFEDAWRSPLRHAAVLAAHFLVIDFAAPFPAPSDFLFRGAQTPAGRAAARQSYWSLSAEEAGWRDWAPAQLALAACMALAVAAAASRTPRNDPRLLAPALVLLWHFALHLLYGREYVLYSPHWHALLVALLVAGLWNGLPARRRWLPWAAVALSAGLLANGVAVMRVVYREVGAGLETSKRDEAGRLRPMGPPMPGTMRRPAESPPG